MSPRAARALVLLPGALAAVCSDSPLEWAGARLSPQLPPYGDATQLLTPWGESVDPAHVLDADHPNPTQSRTTAWCSLNGVWELVECSGAFRFAKPIRVASCMPIR